MKLTAKLVFVLVMGIAALNTLNGYLSIRRQVEVFERLAMDEAAMIGDTIEEMILLAWREQGQESVLQVIRTATQKKHRMQVGWVWFNAPPNNPYSPSVPSNRLAEATLAQHLPVEAAHDDGQRYLHVYWPIAVESKLRGGLEFREPMSELDLQKQNLIYRVLTRTLGQILLATFLAVVMGFYVVGRPLEKLMEKTRRIGTGDLSGPVRIRSRDELGELAASLNGMCEQLAESQQRIREETATRVSAMEQLRHADRLRTVGRLASGLAHEMGTPLNVVSGRASLITSRRLSDTEIQQSAEAIKKEADKITAVIRQLLDFARRGSPQRVPVDLREIVRQTHQLLAPLAEKRQVELSVDDDDQRLQSEADVGQIQQVLSNLILNAIQAMPDGGRVLVELGRKHVQPPEQCGAAKGYYNYISVRDEGEGISKDHIAHLFEPFFTTKDVGEGTGLGLSIAFGIVQEHGGWIDVSSEPGKGSCFCVYLPQESKS